jgi:F-type H+-transporting ATPase subunit a
LDSIGKVTLSTITLFGKSISFNPNVLIMTWVVMASLVLIGYLATRRLKVIPGTLQNIVEIIYDFLREITLSTLGSKDGKKYLPFIVTLFLFILASNWIGVFPNFLRFIGSVIALIHNIFGGESVTIVAEGISNVNMNISNTNWYSFLLNVPEFEEPTRSINTDLALGLVVFVVVHAYGLKNKGLLDYFKDYMDPVPAKAPYIFFFFLNFFFYLNIIGALSNVVSHSFRLFGNMFGGFMIIAIVSSLINYLVVPVGLMAFFGLFAGLVQAFVFTMLAVTYIAQQK